MKEVKAYVRLAIVHKVIEALKLKGYCCMTVINVSGIGQFVNTKDWKYSMEYIEKMSKMAKIELVCSDNVADEIVRIIQENGCTHQRGDGIIFVSNVERAVKIRTGEEGDTVLQHK